MADTVIQGALGRFGDFVSADVMLPARYSFLPPQGMAEQVLMDLGDWANAKVRLYPIVLAGQAFGYGTGRESPSRALRAAGVKAVIATSFSRIFFRNAINNGILVVQCPELVATTAADGDEVAIAMEAGSITWNGGTFHFPPMSEVVLRVLRAGNLVEYGKQLLAQAG